jgi:cell wall-associated NlpC family hydrolase
MLFFNGVRTQNATIPSQEMVSKRNDIIKEAEKYLGRRYKTKIQGQIMDCSGYTRFIMAKFGIKITRSSVTQVKDGDRVKNLKDSKPGDILVFKGRNRHNNIPGHVGMVHHWSNDTLYFIHSSVAKGITIDHMYDPYYSKRFLQVRNVIDK